MSILQAGIRRAQNTISHQTPKTSLYSMSRKIQKQKRKNHSVLIRFHSVAMTCLVHGIRQWKKVIKTNVRADQIRGHDFYDQI